MVFLTFLRQTRVKHNIKRPGSSYKPPPDNWWKRARVFQHTKYDFGRKRNCYSVAIRSFQRRLLFSTKHRRAKHRDMRELHILRIHSATMEHGMEYTHFISNLTKMNIALNRPTLASLAIHEPRTFKSLVDLCKARAVEQGISYGVKDPPKYVFTRGML